MANELEPFLLEFQANSPLAPYLYSRLQDIIRNILSRFIKQDVINDMKCAKDLLKLDVKKESNCMPVKTIDIGFGAKRSLPHGAASDQLTLVVNFRKQAREIMQQTMLKFRNATLLSTLW